MSVVYGEAVVRGINSSRLLDFSDPGDSFEVITRVVTMIVMVDAFEGTLESDREGEIVVVVVAVRRWQVLISLPAACLLSF